MNRNPSTSSANGGGSNGGSHQKTHSSSNNTLDDDRHQSQSNNYHKLGLAEDILINTQLYGLYNPYNYHSFMNTWNFFFPQDCDICNKAMYPLMSGACQCLRCGLYVHRTCLLKMKKKCIYFTFDKINEVAVSTPTSTTNNNNNTTNQKSNKTSAPTTPDSGKHGSSKGNQKPSVVRQIIHKVSIPQLQQAGTLLIGTVAYLPMIAATTIINTATANLTSPTNQSNQKLLSSNTSDPSNSGHGNKGGGGNGYGGHNIPINKELNIKTEIQLEKIIEKACMIPRMIGYLPEPKSQFCLWTSSLRAIALQQSSSFLNYNSNNSTLSSSSSGNAKADNLYYLYYEYLKKKRQLSAEATNHHQGGCIDHTTNTSITPHSMDGSIHNNSNHDTPHAGDTMMLPRESFAFTSSTTNQHTSRKTLHDLSSSHQSYSIICEEINFQQDDSNILYDHPYDEWINTKMTNLIEFLLDYHYISISFPSQVCYVCLITFLSMDFKTILEDYNNDLVLHKQYQQNKLFTNLRRNSTNRNSTTPKNPHQYALHISNPHYHLIITMQHIRECIDTIISAILSKYDTTEMEEKYLSSSAALEGGDNSNHDDLYGGGNDYVTDFMMLLTRIVERTIFQRYEQAVYDKIFRECMIISSLLHEKYIELMNKWCSEGDEESPVMIEKTGKEIKDITQETKRRNTAKLQRVEENENEEEEDGDNDSEVLEENAIKMVRTPSSSKSKDQEEEEEDNQVKEEERIKQRLKEKRPPLPTFTLYNPQYLTIYNEYATKIKQSTSPIDKLKIFVLFLQCLTNTQNQIIVTYPEVKKPEPEPDSSNKEDESSINEVKTNPDDLWNVYQGSVENLKSLVSESDHNSESTEQVRLSRGHQLTDEELLHAPNIDEEEEEAIKPVLHQRISVDNTMVILTSKIEQQEKPVVNPTTPISSEEQENHHGDEEDDIDMNPRSSMIGDMNTDFDPTIIMNKGENGDPLPAPIVIPETTHEKKNDQAVPPATPMPIPPPNTPQIPEPPMLSGAPDTDDLLEKLSIIMYYQQENRLIDWIAECVYLSSPMLNKQYLAYGIDSYALVTFQQAVQLILTSYYHLQANTNVSSSSRRLSWDGRGHRTRISSGERNYYYSPDDENEDYYFWKPFLS